jgi:TRAP-type C4-dicarboxylate transport system permease small subunit
MFSRFVKLFDQSVTHGLVLSIGLLLSFSLINIIGRFWLMSFAWIEPVNRHLVLIICFLGSCLAIAKGQHIKIDLVFRVLEAKNKTCLLRLYRVIILLITGIITFYLLKSSYLFLMQEKQYSQASFLGLPSHYFSSLLTWGFVLLLARITIAIPDVFFSRHQQKGQNKQGETI